MRKESRSVTEVARSCFTLWMRCRCGVRFGAIPLPAFTAPSPPDLPFPLQRPQLHTIPYRIRRSAHRSQIALQGIFNDWLHQSVLQQFSHQSLAGLARPVRASSHFGAPSCATTISDWLILGRQVGKFPRNMIGSCRWIRFLQVSEHRASGKKRAMDGRHPGLLMIKRQFYFAGT
ncbi:uncharacterized protein BJX67DRAFT_240189 [Aspergillus lucknowensis]|uniref:Uncharacterized protein n=1 Tax=Aspergillus lucknowensis TaxID=176173 RepID=A0ABR4LHQ6_9EURO